MSSAAVVHSVDALIVHSGHVIAWGWLLHRDGVVASLDLILESPRRSVRVEGRYGIMRNDVASADLASSTVGCGFVVSGHIGDVVPKKAMLRATLTTGATCGIPVELVTVGDTVGYPRTLLRALAPPDLVTRIRRRYRWAQVLLVQIARQGFHRLLYSRGKNFARLRSAARPEHPLSVDGLIAAWRAATPRSRSLIVDHELGGGTNLYRARWIADRTREGGAVVLLGYAFHRLRYDVRFVTPDVDESYETSSLEWLPLLAGAAGFDSIFLNNVCSFPDPLVVVELMLRLRRITGATLTVPVHDFFSVCPSWHLLDDTGRFCAVPAVERCRRCLPRIGGAVRALGGGTDIDRWRAAWGRCLEEATTVLCFSEASRALMTRAYPRLGRDKFVIRPHAVDELPRRLVHVNGEAPLHIGVVGEITEAKGAAVVRSMARLIRSERLSARITVIGQLHGAHESRELRILGPYQREALPDLVEGCGANVFLVPSVWPETYCYVADELMRLGVPVAVFNLGAPAERVARYEHGLVIERLDAVYALRRLAAFHAERHPRSRWTG
ncbi:MAG: hypothetical protein DMD81_23460 [Candidatus Rokuibacteriota bacterium]|nr:MAG: hypothetical protein DMD81_23460 [Candidatus Rokubacteria bacterium]